jgi:parallel beta-helix repeat protein
VATNTRTEARFHALDHAISAAEAGDTISAVGAFTGQVEVDRPLTIQGTDATLHGAFDVLADTSVVRGFVVEAEGLDHGLSVEGDGVTIAGNVLHGAAIGIVVTGSSATIQDNRFVDNDLGISLEAAGATVTGNRFDLEPWAEKVYVEDTTSSYDLTAILEANTFDPDAEVRDRQIVPAVAQEAARMLEIVRHNTGGKQGPFTEIRYTGDVSCVASPEVAAQFALDRGKKNQETRAGTSIICSDNNTIIIHWDGSANQPNHVDYHADGEHALTDTGGVAVKSPDRVVFPANLAALR